MFWFSSCPRCTGDLFQPFDEEYLQVFCLQCSHELTDPEVAYLLAPASRADDNAAIASAIWRWNAREVARPPRRGRNRGPKYPTIDFPCAGSGGM